MPDSVRIRLDQLSEQDKLAGEKARELFKNLISKSVPSQIATKGTKKVPQKDT